MIKWIILIILLIVSTSVIACSDKLDKPGSEIICPAEQLLISQDLKEKGFGIIDMDIIDAAVCDITNDKNGKKKRNMWCEHRKVNDSLIIYIVVYPDKDKKFVYMILFYNLIEKKYIVFYDIEKKIDI